MYSQQLSRNQLQNDKMLGWQVRISWVLSHQGGKLLLMRSLRLLWTRYLLSCCSTCSVYAHPVLPSSTGHAMPLSICTSVCCRRSLLYDTHASGDGEVVSSGMPRRCEKVRYRRTVKPQSCTLCLQAVQGKLDLSWPAYDQVLQLRAPQAGVVL